MVFIAKKINHSKFEAAFMDFYFKGHKIKIKYILGIKLEVALILFFTG